MFFIILLAAMVTDFDAVIWLALPGFDLLDPCLIPVILLRNCSKLFERLLI